jgi:thiol-disulfide isomerase/thioredoxin
MKPAVVLFALIVCTCGALFINAHDAEQVSPRKEVTVPSQDNHALRSLSTANGWINSHPLAAADLRGKVVLVQFGTFSCINWIRTLPYVRSWADKYQSQGLVVIGVQTPEFAFERNAGNITRAVDGFGIKYPVAIDDDYTIWNAFANRSWPALYLIDATGAIRHQQFGEGGYERSEQMIQKLLAEAGHGRTGPTTQSIAGHGVEAAADWDNLKSGENYVGHERTENFESPEAPGSGHVYTFPSKLSRNHWALSGDWTVTKQTAVLNRAGGRILYRFHARDLHLVMGSAVPGASVRFRVLIDGKRPGVAHGIDLDAEGSGVVTDHRLYQLIRQADTITDRQFEIEFIDPRVEAFSFTFG